jgi:hypothetical protein
MYAPWIVHGTYIEWLMKAIDLVEESQGDVSIARSASAQIGMAWDRSARIVWIERRLENDDAFRVTFEYADELSSSGDEREGDRLPVGFVTQITRGGNTVPVARWEIDLIDDAKEGDLVFDPIALDLAHFDTGSGDVVHPVHGFLYNQHKVDRALGGRDWRAYARIIAGVGIVLIVALLVLRALRSKSTSA